MKERPILFSGPMVQPVLDDKKTKTRRVIPWLASLECCPYGVPGDRLWVRETWTTESPRWDGEKPEAFMDSVLTHNDALLYKATDKDADRIWRPSIFMPRWASRITLEITDVRVERLQDISEADAEAEGATPQVVLPGDAVSYVAGFYWLWDSINAKRGYGWDRNPLVWVITFRRLKGESK